LTPPRTIAFDKSLPAGASATSMANFNMNYHIVRSIKCQWDSHDNSNQNHKFMAFHCQTMITLIAIKAKQKQEQEQEQQQH
jgi:hypothetical protein